MPRRTPSQIRLDRKLRAPSGDSITGEGVIDGYISPLRLGTGTDIATKYLRGDGTWQTVSAGASTWGSITGTLSSQTDLQTALNGKASSTHTHPQSDVTNLTSDLALKAPLAGPTFTGTVTLPSTTSIGTVTSVELGYLSGVTSSLQTQLNGKAAR